MKNKYGESYVTDFVNEPAKFNFRKVLAGLFLLVMAALFGTYANATDVEGLETSKKVKGNGDGTYTITMETYTTGEVKSEAVSVPLDIVLVLDQSGSMGYSFAGASTRQAALKTALNNFVNSVNEKYTAEANHRVSLVTYGDSPKKLQDWTYADASGKSTLLGKINGLPAEPEGATETCEGMEMAETLIGNLGSDTKRQRVVILFTDGCPTSQEWFSSDFSMKTANKSIASANRLLNNNVVVYSVGIQDGANADVYNLNIGQNYYCADGEDDVEYLANRFLNYLSGNFKPADAPDMGGTSDEDAWTVKFKPTVNYPRSKDGFYLTANNAEALNNIFQKIVHEIVVPTISLGSETVMKDTVSPYFDMPSDISKVSFYTAAYNGSVFGARQPATGLTPVISGNVLTVSGFDFDANVCTKDAHPDGSHGNKLIIEFTITPKTGFLGGNGIPTNDQENSGVISKDNVLIENYVADYGGEKGGVDVPLLEFRLRVPETNVYENDDYGDDILAKLEISTDGGASYVLFDTWASGLEEWKKQFIKDIVPIFKEEDGKAIVELEPTITGSVEKETVTAEMTLNVFKPILTFKDATVEAGKNVGTDFYTANNYLTSKTVWKCGSTASTSVTMTGSPATIALTYSPASFTAPNEGGEKNIVVTVTTNGKASGATFLWERDSKCPSSETVAPSGAQFRIHCLTALLDITITKIVEDINLNDHFIFTVTGPDNYKARVVVAPNSSVKIKGLVKGEYTVQEESWSWAYTATNPSTGKITQDISKNNTFTFTNTPKGNVPLHDESYKNNKFEND